MCYTILSPNIFMEVWFPMVVGMPLQSGAPVTIVGEGNRRHSFVSMNDVAAFAAAAVEHPAARISRSSSAARSRCRGTTSSNARVRCSDASSRSVEQPGEPLPGLPDVVSGLLAGMDTYDSPVDMTATASTFDVQLTSSEQALRQLFAAK